MKSRSIILLLTSALLGMAVVLVLSATEVIYLENLFFVNKRSFSETTFDKGYLETILATPDCKGLRFYNVLIEQTDSKSGRMMVVAVNSDLADIRNLNYHRCDRLVGNRSFITDLDESQALNGCRWAQAKGYDIFSIYYSKEEMKAMMENTDGVALRYFYSKKYKRSSAIIEGVKITSDGVTYQDISIKKEPCPTVCPIREDFTLHQGEIN